MVEKSQSSTSLKSQETGNVTGLLAGDQGDDIAKSALPKEAQSNSEEILVPCPFLRYIAQTEEKDADELAYQL